MKLSNQEIIPTDSEKGRTYQLILPNNHIMVVPSVSTILSIIEKPALVPWAFNVGVEECFDAVAEKPDEFHSANDVKQYLKQEERTNESRKKAGGERGNAVHNAFEKALKDEAYSIDDYSPEYAGYIRMMEKFVEDYRPEAIAMEQRTASINEEFAGRFDAIVRIRKHPSRRRHESLVGKVVLLDLKTNAEGRVYPRMHLPQVEAYRFAYEETGEGGIDECLVVGIGQERFSPCVSYATIDTFRHIKDAYEAFRIMENNNPNGRKKR
jgi:hypothetical protein